MADTPARGKLCAGQCTRSVNKVVAVVPIIGQNLAWPLSASLACSVAF
jgi:hypothetical protein